MARGPFSFSLRAYLKKNDPYLLIFLNALVGHTLLLRNQLRESNPKAQRPALGPLLLGQWAGPPRVRNCRHVPETGSGCPRGQRGSQRGCTNRIRLLARLCHVSRRCHPFQGPRDMEAGCFLRATANGRNRAWRMSGFPKTTRRAT